MNADGSTRTWSAPDPAVPVAKAVRARRTRVPFLNLFLITVTFVTTTVAGALNADVAPAELATRWTSGLPFAITLMSILLAHEMGHYVLARFHDVRVTLPFFLPAPPFYFTPGTFGAFIRMRSLPPNRRVLFDVGAAGPWAGVLVAIPAVMVGLSLSEVRPIPPTLTGIEFGDSLLFKLLSRIVIGPVPYGFDIILHPVALAAWFGLFVTMLNLLPIGQLDGGHVVYAMFGRRHRWIARLGLPALVVVGILGWPGWFLWVVLLLLVGIDHPPPVDSTTTLDAKRRVGGWLTLALFVFTFMPVPIRMIEGGDGLLPEQLIAAIVSFGG